MLSLGRVMSPQAVSCNGRTKSGDGLMAAKQQQQKDLLVVNSVKNSHDISELGRVVSDPLSMGERLGSCSSPSNLVNFSSLEVASGESKEAPSQAEMAGEVEDGCSRIWSPSPQKVAVIGAGAAGLVAARELVREGHEVVVYEQSEVVGGVWQYDPRVEDDPAGINPYRSRVHSSMYQSLRTNLPREIMGYLDYPFEPKEGEGRDGRRFPVHREVARYLEDFARDYNLMGLVKFGREVDYVGQRHLKWIVHFEKMAGSENEREDSEKDRLVWERQAEIFDAVVICNGHYSEPRVVPIPGMNVPAHNTILGPRVNPIPGVESWPGVQMHSHNYRFPRPFRDKVVVVVGNGNSATDITSEIATVAKEVHQCARGWTSLDSSMQGQGPRNNIFHHPMVTKACSDGAVEFQDGKSTVADIILYCTGFLFSFPFLDTKGYISVDDNRVGPLYKHVFPPALAPKLSIVGLPWKVVPFQLMELQSRWIARVLSGRSSLPTESEMMSDIKILYEQLEATLEFPKSYTHMIGPNQAEYDGWLAEQSEHEPVESWRMEMYLSVSRNKRAHPDTYRDEMVDQHWYEVAMASFARRKVPSKDVSSAEENS